MLLRPFLNDAGLVRELPVRLHDPRQARGRRPARRPRRRLPRGGRARSASPIVAVFETHVQADHVSGLPALVERTGATAYLPAGAGVDFDARRRSPTASAIELGNTIVTALATPGHAPAHHAYVVADRRRGTDEPWLVFTGDSLLVGDVGRPDLHVAGDAARPGPRSCTARSSGCSSCPITSSLYPSHYAGSVCGRGLSGNPFSLDRLRARAQPDARSTTIPDAFVEALVADTPAAARAAGGDRRREPRGASADAPRDAPVRLGLRENAAQFSLLVGLNALVGAMVGLERTSLPLIGERGLRARRRRRDPLLHRRLRPRQGVHEPRRRRARRQRRPQAAARRRLARRAAGPAADRPRAELGLDRRRERPARRQPGPRLVDDRRDEDRPRRAARGAASRSGSTRRPATSASRSPASLTRRARRHLRAADGHLGRRQRVIALAGFARLVSVRARHRRARRPRAARSRPGRAARSHCGRRFIARRPSGNRCCARARQAGLVNNLNDALAWGLVPLFLAAHGASVRADRARRRRLPGASGAPARSSPAGSPTTSGASR